MKFGDYLRQKREESGWTQPEAAAKAKIEQSYLSKLETGKSYPSEDIFERLVSAYSMDTAEMSAAIFSAELDKLREIKAVRAAVLARQKNQSLFMRGWLIAGLVMIMIGGAVLGLAYSIPDDQRMKFHYRSEGVIMTGESPQIFELLEDGREDANGKNLSERTNYDFQVLRDNKGPTYIVPAKGGYRKYSLYDKRHETTLSPLVWLYGPGLMFLFGGLACFYIARRWQ